MLPQRKAVFTMYFISYLLFIICAVTYDLHQYNLSVLIRVFDQAAVTEQVLKQTPTCAPDDRSRQRALLYTLQAWTNLAHPHHIRYWLSHQALTSQTQSHGSFPYAHSIDISMMTDDILQLTQWTKANTSSTYELQVHPQWNSVPAVQRSLLPFQKINFVKNPARLLNLEHNVSVNIWPIYDSVSHKNLLVGYDNQENRRTVSEEWVFPLRPCFFNGVKVWCPAEPSKLLASMSGDQWRRKSMLNCIDGKWVTTSMD